MWLNKVLTPVARLVIPCVNATTTTSAGSVTLELASRAVYLESRGFRTWCCVEFNVDEEDNLVVLDGPYAIELNNSTIRSPLFNCPMRSGYVKL